MTNPFDSFIHAVLSDSSELSSTYSEQQLAVLNAPIKSNGLVIACPGAGKTKVLIDRAAKVLKAGADPSKTALLTFTKEAANQFKKRLEGSAVKVLPVCSTIHALAYSLLRKSKDLNILTDEQCEAIVTAIKPQFEFLADRNSKDILKDLNLYRELLSSDPLWEEVVNAYEQKLTEIGAQDFTFILKMCMAKKSLPSFKFIFVDEFQDLSPLQYAFLQKIGNEDSAVWYIGDPDQSIYSFKGSAEGVISDLCNKYKACTYYLTVNYRSHSNIVKASTSVISHNLSAVRKPITAHSSEDGAVTVESFSDEKQEFEFLKDWELKHPEGIVLVRTNRQIEKYSSEVASVKILTVHDAKGLEWPHVLILGCESTSFPHILGELREERRLFYVAMSRAQHSLTLTYCRSRKKKDTLEPTTEKDDRSPSPFLYEQQLVNFESLDPKGAFS